MLLQKKKSKRIISAALCLLIFFACMMQPATAVFAETPYETYARLKKEKQELEKDISANKNNLSKALQVKEAYSKKAELERQMLESLAAQIQDSEQALLVKQQEIEAKILDVKNTQELFENRLIAIYKKQERSTLSALLSAGSFGELLRVGKNLKKVAQHDTETINLLQQQQAELEVVRGQLETQLADLNTQKEEREQLKAQYEQSMLNAQNAANAAAAAQKASEAAYAELLPQYEESERVWQEWLSQDTQGGEYIGGAMMWPLPGYYKISSGFGDVRIIYGKRDVHRGIDMPAPAGTPVYAASDGKVSINGHHWTYGKCIKISHGGGVVSVYAHMSAFAAGISDGMAVTQGTLIGYVGSTGQSTGSHLHFEVDVNGVPTNPNNYLKG